MREEAVSALRFDKRNSGLLLDLLKTEKGSSLEVTRQVLVLMDTAESEQYLETLLDNTPWEAMKYLNFSRSSSELDLVTRRVIQKLEGDNVSDEILKEYADPDSERYKNMCEGNSSPL